MGRPESGKTSVVVCRCFRICGHRLDRPDSGKSSAVQHFLSSALCFPRRSHWGSIPRRARWWPPIETTRITSRRDTVLSTRLPLAPRRHSTGAPGKVTAYPAVQLRRYVQPCFQYSTRRGNVLPSVTSSAPRRPRTGVACETLNRFSGPLRIYHRRALAVFLSQSLSNLPSRRRGERTAGAQTS